MCRLRRPGAVIEFDELPRHALNVPGVQEDEVIERVFAQRTTKSLDMWIRIGGVERRGHPLDVHRARQPSALMTAESVSSPPELSEDAVVVVQQKSRLAISRGDVAGLDLHPVDRGALCRVAEHDTPGADLHHDENVDGCEQRRVLRHEVASVELVTVVLDEGAPLLPIISRSPPHHVPTNGASGVADAELDSQLFVDLVFTPGRMVSTHPSDKRDVLRPDTGSSRTPGARSSAPVELEAPTVPANHGLGFDEDERGLPAVPEPGEPHPECPIG
jgi:hypothetical protein